MLPYRQRWKAGPSQAGDLRATIPLAPNETRKYTKKTNVRTSRAAKEIERSITSHSTQLSDVRRPELDIMSRTTTNTNFKTSVSGQFYIGIGGINASSDFAVNQATEPAPPNKELPEPTV